MRYLSFEDSLKMFCTGRFVAPQESRKDKFIKLSDEIFNFENILQVRKEAYISDKASLYPGMKTVFQGIAVMLKTQKNELSVLYNTEKERDAAFAEIEKALIG